MGLKNPLEPADPADKDLSSNLDKIKLLADTMETRLHHSLKIIRVMKVLGGIVLAVLFVLAFIHRHHHWTFIPMVSLLFIVGIVLERALRLGASLHGARLDTLCLLKFLGEARTGLTRRVMGKLPPEARPN